MFDLIYLIQRNTRNQYPLWRQEGVGRLRALRICVRGGYIGWLVSRAEARDELVNR